MKPSDTEKASILRNSIKFRNQDRSDEVKDIIVTPDWTHPNKQETSKKLCPELRELNIDGS